MKTENPAALHFIMQDDLFFLKSDAGAYTHKAAAMETAAPQIEPIAEPVTATIETPKIKFKYLGSNKKSFLITVHYPNTEYMADAHFTALENTLKRLGFAMDDVAIVNLAGYIEADLVALTTCFAPQKLLLLGKNALPKGFAAIKLNEQQSVNNIATLFTYSFDEMMDSNEYKKAFWEQMKLL